MSGGLAMTTGMLMTRLFHGGNITAAPPPQQPVRSPFKVNAFKANAFKGVT